MKKYNANSGWFLESQRHSLARQGIKTGRKDYARSVDVFGMHRKRIAIDTLRMPDAMVGIMGGMNKSEAKSFLKSIGYTDEQIKNIENPKKVDYSKSNLSKSLESLPTLAVGQADDLKIDTGTRRVWVSRVDGSVSVERLKNGKWEIVDEDIDYSKHSKDFIHGSLADDKPDSAFNSSELKAGIKVEMEHTSDPKVAKEIAKDHLAEFPSYYKALALMEKKLNTHVNYTKSEGIPLEDPTRYKFGSIQWQGAMLHNVILKKRLGEKLSSPEKTFMAVQREHNKRIDYYQVTYAPTKVSIVKPLEEKIKESQSQQRIVSQPKAVPDNKKSFSQKEKEFQQRLKPKVEKFKESFIQKEKKFQQKLVPAVIKAEQKVGRGIRSGFGQIWKTFKAGVGADWDDDKKIDYMKKCGV